MAISNGTLILFQPTDNPPLLKPVVAMGEPVNGIVALAEPVETPDGPTTHVPASQCHEFDEFLMKSVNRMVAEAVDLISVANEMLKLRAVPAFGTEPNKQAMH